MKEQLAKVLQTNEILFFYTRCCLREFESLVGNKELRKPALEGLDRLKCRHEEESGAEAPPHCLESLVSHFDMERTDSLILAVQNKRLRIQLAKSSGSKFPFVYLNKQVLCMENPSIYAHERISKNVHNALKVPEIEKKVLNISDDPASNPTSKKRKKKKQPNPLSCKKKKNTPVETPKSEANFNSSGSSSVKIKRARKKRKICQGPQEAVVSTHSDSGIQKASD